MPDTRDESYARRLDTLGGAAWKRWLNVQAPYRWNLRRQDLGRTLDVGCGIGRNLATLPAGSVGVDHNTASVQLAVSRGLVAVDTDEWPTSEHNRPASFDGILLAHVVEHMTVDDALGVLTSYLPVLRPGGKVFFICPQERGYRTDATHVQFTTGEDLQELSRRAGLVPERWRSFPLPRRAGKVFTYNEFTLLAHKPTGD
jgi:2-polyprenyl-3-methyl-5-hydroxy-6-metoxy-1,4-benzoquinol methylase